MEEETTFENFEMQLNESAKGFLKETAKWAYFLSILGYIGIGLIAMVAIFAGALFSFIGNMTQEMNGFGAIGGSFISGLYLMLAILYFFPVYYLNKFASNAKAALRNNDSELLTSSFEYLKSHYKFIGILAIVMMCMYALIIVGVIIVAVAFGLK